MNSESNKPTIRRCISWAVVLISFCGAYFSYSALPGAGGPAGEILWMLDQPKSTQLNRAVFLLTLMDLRNPNASAEAIKYLFDYMNAQRLPRMMSMMWFVCEPSSRVNWVMSAGAISAWLQNAPPEMWEKYAADIAKLWNAFSYAPTPSPEWAELSRHLSRELLERRFPVCRLLHGTAAVDVFSIRGSLLMLLSAESPEVRQECLRRLSIAGGTIGRTASFRDGVLIEFDADAACVPSEWAALELRIAPQLRSLLSSEDAVCRCKASEILAICGDTDARSVLRECAAIDDLRFASARRILEFLTRPH